MSETWEHFMRQYRAQGPEKAEGYEERHFAGMEFAERARAAELLRRELPGSPSAASGGLVLLGDEFAVQALLRFVREYDGQEVDNIDQAYYALWRLTDDPLWQVKMIESYPLTEEAHRGGFMLRLRETPPSPEMWAFLEEVAVVEEDFAGRTLAGELLLDVAGVPDETEEEQAQRAAMMQVFRGGTQQERRTLVQRLALGQ